MPGKFLTQVGEIVHKLGHSVNPAVQYGAANSETVAAITEESGKPIRALLTEADQLTHLQLIRRYLPVHICIDDSQRKRFKKGMKQLPEPDHPQTSRSRWEQAFSEWKPLLHWEADDRCQVPYKTLLRRLETGWDLEKALTTTAAEKRAKTAKGKDLYRHASGQWAKRVRGVVYYFGSGDYESALELYKAERPALEAGRPQNRNRSLTLKDMAQRFMEAKQAEVDRGEITGRTFRDYHAVLQRAIKVLGAKQYGADMDMDCFRQLHRHFAEGVSQRTCGNLVRRFMAFVNWVNAHQLLERDLRPGPDFKPPSIIALRREANANVQKHGLRLFEPDEVKLILDNCKPAMKAMVLLACNCGCGNTDCSNLNQSHLDLKGGWLNYPRPKTQIPRQAKLWPETVSALKAAIAIRPDPKDEDDLDAVFITKYGRRYVRDEGLDDSIAKEFSKLLVSLELKRRGLNFYALRHTFQTYADEHADDTATKLVMGHSDTSMSAVYRQRFPVERLEKLAESVRKRLFENAPNE